MTKISNIFYAMTLSYTFKHIFRLIISKIRKILLEHGAKRNMQEEEKKWQRPEQYRFAKVEII